MSAQTQQGYLVLADISGYTSYVAQTELEHAHEIVSELLELLLAQLTPTLTLSKLEGDAVFAYAPEARLSRPETVIELLETTYVAFRDRVEGIRRRTTCDCNACRAIPTLDLKFMAHHGSYIEQSVAGHSELIGSDVNLVHRLSKNHVSEATGWRGYALFTERFLQHLEAPLAGTHPQTESYEHLGDVQTFSINLRTGYNELSATRRVVLTPDEADTVFTYDFDQPPPVVWEWLNDPQKRTQWMPLDRQWSAGVRPGGRTGVGARNHCAHGKTSITETILDWKPFDYMTSEQTDGKMILLETVQLEPLRDGQGTRIRNTIKANIPLPRFLRKPVCTFVVTQVAKYKGPQVFATLARLMASEQPTAVAQEVSR